MKNLKQGDNVTVKETGQLLIVGYVDTRVSPTKYYLTDRVGVTFILNEEGKHKAFDRDELELVVVITYVNTMHEHLPCGGKKSHTYPMRDKELAALHFYQLFNNPYKYKNLKSTFDFETIKIR